MSDVAGAPPRDLAIDLVERARAGDEDAFHALFQRYRRLVYSLAIRLLNDPAEADDLTQEVFLVVHRRITTLRNADRLRPWLCRITLTRAYNVERSFRRRLRGLTIPLEQWSGSLGRRRQQTTNPERALVSTEARRRIDAALAALPFHYRTVVVLRDIEGLSYEEIAEVADVSLGTVKSRLARGREALREQLHDLVRWHREVTS